MKTPPISSDYLARLQREVAPGETARFQMGGTLIEFVPRPPVTAGAAMVVRHATHALGTLRRHTLLFPSLRRN